MVLFTQYHLRLVLWLVLLGSLTLIFLFTRPASRRSPAEVASDGWDRYGRRRFVMAARLALGHVLPGVRVLPPAIAGVWGLRVSAVGLVIAQAGAMLAGV